MATNIQADKKYCAQVGSSMIVEIIMTGEDILNICHSGSNDDEVDDVCEREDIQEQLKKYSDERFVAVLQEYGAWEDFELQDRKANESRIIWLGAWDLFDSDEVEPIE